MNNSSRASPPPPLNLASLPPDAKKSGLSRLGTGNSSVASTPRSKQSASYFSASSSASPSFAFVGKASSGFIKSSPTVNVHTTCGRHTDQLLFGGPSLKDLARSIKNWF